MYGQDLGFRPDAPGEPIFTKFCKLAWVPDVFLSFEFQKDRVKNVGSLYRTSRDWCREMTIRTSLGPHKPWLV